MIYCFGDSWGAGAELNKGEKPFVELLNKPYKNYSVEGNSYPKIVSQVFDYIHEINSEDIVLVVIPPDIRWMQQDGKAFRPFNLSEDGYLKWVSGKDEYWFRYHASLFTYSIQSALDSIGCTYLFMHNYGGEFIVDDRFKSLINTDNFLDIKKSLTTLLEANDAYQAWEKNVLTNKIIDGPVSESPFVEIKNRKVFNSKYFEGNASHPNQLGHYRIKELIEDALIKRT